MNLKLIQRIIIISLFAGNLCNAGAPAAPIAVNPGLPKIFGSNIDSFFKKPDNNLFTVYQSEWNADLGLHGMPNPSNHPSNPFNLLNTSGNKLVAARTQTAPNLLIVDDPFTGNIAYSRNPLNPGVIAVALSANDLLVTATRSSITVTNINNGRNTTTNFSAEIACITISKEDNPYLAVALKSREIFIYSIDANAVLTTITSFRYGSSNTLVTAMCFLAMSHTLIVGYNNGQVIQWNNINNPIKLKNKVFHKAVRAIKKIDISHFDQYISIFTDSGQISIYELQNYPLFPYYSLYITINSINPSIITSMNFLDGLPYLLISTASEIKLVNFTNSNYIFSKNITLDNQNSIILYNQGQSISTIESIVNWVFFIDNNNLKKFSIPSVYSITALHAQRWIQTLKGKNFLADYYFNTERNLLENNTLLNEALTVNEKNIIFLDANFQPLNTLAAKFPTWITARNALILGGGVGTAAYGYYYLRKHPELLQKLTSGFSSTAAQTAESAQAAAPLIEEVAQKAPKVIAPPSTEMLQKMKGIVTRGVNLVAPSK